MLSWLPAGLPPPDLMCDLWLKWMDQELMRLQARWHGQISLPCSHTTHNAMPIDRRSQAEDIWITCLPGCQWEYKCFFTQLMITVVWHQFYIWGEIWNGLNLLEQGVQPGLWRCHVTVPFWIRLLWNIQKEMLTNTVDTVIMTTLIC